jgi:hypothetical protein
MSEHIIHLYRVFNNTINEIPTRGDNASCSYNVILKTFIVLGVKKFQKQLWTFLVLYFINKNQYINDTYEKLIYSKDNECLENHAVILC